VLLTISDADGKPVRVLTAPPAAGVHRVTWDLRLPAPALPRPAGPEAAEEEVFGRAPGGPLILPGKYSVSLAKRVDGKVTPLAGPVTFEVRDVGQRPLSAEDAKVLAAFQRDLLKLQRDLAATQAVAGELATRLEQIKAALDQTPAAPAAARERVRKAIAAHRTTQRELSGDAALRARYEDTPMSVAERANVALAALRTSIHKPTGTQREQYAFARADLDAAAAAMRNLIDGEVKDLEKLLDDLGAPHTPGRLPGGK